MHIPNFPQKQCYRRWIPCCLFSVIIAAVYSVFTMEQSSVSLGYLTAAYSHRKPSVNSIHPHDTIKVCDATHVHPQRKVYATDCAAVLRNDTAAIHKAMELMERPINLTTDAEVAADTSNCASLRARYTTCAYSEEERQYPIAYTILGHADAVQVERLLRNIYQPQNVYCLAPDAKSSTHFHRVMSNLAQCFPNVFIASKLETVIYAHISRLQAEINCFKDLLKRKEKWKYVINLTGQVFPLKTNLEMVKILKIYNGANDIEGEHDGHFQPWRVRWKFVVNETGLLDKTHTKKGPVPGGLKLIKGKAYAAFSRAFLNYTMENPLAETLYNWSQDVWSPDEHYWATLNHLSANPQLKSPGGFHGEQHMKPWLAAYIKWDSTVIQQSFQPCYGKYVRLVCIMGLQDLPDLVPRKEMFVNKLYYHYQPLALDCLEEWYSNITISKRFFNETYYKNLPFVIPK